MRAAIDDQPIDTVITGAGLDLETRLRVVRHIMQASPATRVHLGDRESGPRDMLPFAHGVLNALV